MLKKSLVVCITAVLVVMGATTTAAQTDRTRDGLTGMVKMVTEESGTWVEGSIIFVQTTVYDRAGNTAEFEISQYKVGSSRFPERLRSIYERNAHGKIAVKKSFDEAGVLQSQVVYIYDEKANRTEERHLDKDGRLLLKFIKTYDTSGHEVETKSYSGDGSLKSKWQSVYDQKGNLVLHSSFTDCVADQNCRTLEYKAVNTYDSQGNLTESLILKSDGKIDEKRVNRYDSANHLIEKATFNADGSLREKEVYSYKFDESGNWIERVTSKLNANSRLEQASTNRRTITYYAGSEKS